MALLQTHLRIVVALGVLSLVVIAMAFAVSLHWNVCYGGRFVFFSLTDGYVFVGSSLFTERTWGEWGWWIQSPWSTRHDWSLPRLFPWPPWLADAPQFLATALYLPLTFLFALVYCLTAYCWALLGHAWHWRVARYGGMVVLATMAATIFDSLKILIIAVVLVLIRGWLGYRAKPRFPPGHCQSCGYNLTANTSGRCPECGTPCAIVPQSGAQECSHGCSDSAKGG